jgi:long-chain acyl-CoA synthetase
MEPEKLEKLLKIPVVSWLVKRKLLKALGLQDVRYAGSGSAPLPSDLLSWYRNLGLELLEGYGMTENFNCKSTDV